MASRPRRAPASQPDALRPPLQNRSRASLERVLDAGEKLLVEKGWEGFTVQEVSRRAKVSIGSIYARAPSKEALILAVYDRAVERIAEENAAALSPDEQWEGLDAREVIIGATREMAEQMLAHQDTLRVFMNRAPVDEVIKERGAVQVRRLASRYEELLLRHKDEFTHPDPDLAIEIAFRMAFAPMSRRVSLGPEFGAYREVDDERLIAELGRAIAAYLLEPPLRAVGAGKKRGR
jgi:AcrR family transcriptional regulator